MLLTNAELIVSLEAMTKDRDELRDMLGRAGNREAQVTARLKEVERAAQILMAECLTNADGNDQEIKLTVKPGHDPAVIEEAFRIMAEYDTMEGK